MPTLILAIMVETPMNKGIEVSHMWDSLGYFWQSVTENSPYFVIYEIEAISLISLL